MLTFANTELSRIGIVPPVDLVGLSMRFTLIFMYNANKMGQMEVKIILYLNSSTEDLKYDRNYRFAKT